MRRGTRSKERVFLERVFLEKVFLDSVILASVLSDGVRAVFLDAVLLDTVLLDTAHLGTELSVRGFLRRAFLGMGIVGTRLLDRGWICGDAIVAVAALNAQKLWIRQLPHLVGGEPKIRLSRNFRHYDLLPCKAAPDPNGCPPIVCTQSWALAEPPAFKNPQRAPHRNSKTLRMLVTDMRCPRKHLQ
jgi:hypothetical protein